MKKKVVDRVVESSYKESYEEIEYLKKVYSGDLSNISSDIVNSCKFSLGVRNNYYQETQ